MNPKTGMSVVEATIVLAILLLIAAISAPGFTPAPSRRSRSAGDSPMDMTRAACPISISERGRRSAGASTTEIFAAAAGERLRRWRPLQTSTLPGVRSSIST